MGKILEFTCGMYLTIDEMKAAASEPQYRVSPNRCDSWRIEQRGSEPLAITDEERDTLLALAERLMDEPNPERGIHMRYFGEIVLADGTRQPIQKKELYDAVDALRSEIIARRILEQDSSMLRPMGLVACMDPPPGGPMQSFLNMEMIMKKPAAPQRDPDGSWRCICGQTGLRSKFCPECGTKAPEDGSGYIR